MPSPIRFQRVSGLPVRRAGCVSLTDTPPASATAFKVAARQARRAQRAALLYARAMQALAGEPPRLKAQRPLHSSRADLWAWYEAQGRSWAQFVADHGPG